MGAPEVTGASPWWWPHSSSALSSSPSLYSPSAEASACAHPSSLPPAPKGSWRRDADAQTQRPRIWSVFQNTYTLIHFNLGNFLKCLVQGTWRQSLSSLVSQLWEKKKKKTALQIQEGQWEASSHSALLPLSFQASGSFYKLYCCSGWSGNVRERP